MKLSNTTQTKGSSCHIGKLLPSIVMQMQMRTQMRFAKAYKATNRYLSTGCFIIITYDMIAIKEAFIYL